MCACVSYSSRNQGAVSRRGAFSIFLFFMLSAVAVYLYHAVSFCCGSHGTTVAVVQGVLLVKTANGASVCACVRM